MLNAVPPPILDPIARAQLEQTYRQQLSAVVLLARLLGLPCPIKTHAERARERSERETG